MTNTFPREAIYPFENEDPAHWAPFSDWEKQSALTIDAICALSFGVHPMLVNLVNSNWTSYQISVWNDRRRELISATHAGRIKKAQSNIDAPISGTCLVITEDALEYFGGKFVTQIPDVKFPLKKKIDKQQKSKDRRETKRAAALRILVKHVLHTIGKNWSDFKTMLGDHSKELPYDGYGDCTNIYLNNDVMHFVMTQDDGKEIRDSINITSLKRYFAQAKQPS